MPSVDARGKSTSLTLLTSTGHLYSLAPGPCHYLKSTAFQSLLLSFHLILLWSSCSLIRILMITLGPINFGMLMSEGKEKDLTGHLGVMNIQKVTETILDNGHIEKWFLRFFFIISWTLQMFASEKWKSMHNFTPDFRTLSALCIHECQAKNSWCVVINAKYPVRSLFHTSHQNTFWSIKDFILTKENMSL